MMQFVSQAMVHNISKLWKIYVQWCQIMLKIYAECTIVKQTAGKGLMNILLLESIHPVAKARLEEEGYHVDILDYSPDIKDMKELFSQYDAIGIRSKTQLDQEILKNSPHIMAIGCFCIGTNQVDLMQAKKQGACVFNAPHSNTRSVAELVLAEMVMLSRQLGDRNTMAHKGTWLKSAKGANEIRGKQLGIIGYGHIGSQVSVLAESFGLRVAFYDVTKKLPLGNAQVVHDLDELLSQSDFVTLHVPETDETKDMISMRELSKMKRGSYLINASRGSVVVIDDLVKMLKDKHIAGAAVDVFPLEPSSNDDIFESPLQNCENVILTPHIGGSTEEAQLAIGLEVAESLIQYLGHGSTAGAVNFPNIAIAPRKKGVRIVNVHKNVPGVLGKINGLISNLGANIETQFLTTDEEIGYLVLDVVGNDVTTLVDQIKELDSSISTRTMN